jgi:hypothetical protein
MKRLLLAALLVNLICTSVSFAAAPCPPKSRYGEWIKIEKDGVITYRYVYRGFRNGFPPPAMYYYGYPQSGYTYGTGLEQSR